MRAQETIHIARHWSPALFPYWPNTLTAYLHLHYKITAAINQINCTHCTHCTI